MNTIEYPFDEKLCEIWWNASVIGLALVSADGKFLRTNKALQHMVKYNGTEMLGLSYQDLTHRGDLSADEAEVKKILDKKTKSYEMTKRYITKLDDIIWVRIIVQGHHDDDGNFLFFFVQVVPQFIAGKNLTKPTIIPVEKDTKVIIQILQHLLRDNWKFIIAAVLAAASYIANELFKNIELQERMDKLEGIEETLDDEFSPEDK